MARRPVMTIPVDGDAELSAQSQDLSDELVAHYRQLLTTHTNEPNSGTGQVCGVARCPDWMNSYDALAAAHQLMATSPPPWEPFHPCQRTRVKPYPQPAPGLTRQT